MKVFIEHAARIVEMVSLVILLISASSDSLPLTATRLEVAKLCSNILGIAIGILGCPNLASLLSFLLLFLTRSRPGVTLLLLQTRANGRAIS